MGTVYNFEKVSFSASDDYFIWAFFMAEASRLNVGEENDMGEVRLKEDLRCAEESGEQALASLYAVRAKLNSAKKWGILEIGRAHV